MNFAIGSLVHARGREWVVLPSDDEEALLLRPLGGSEDETVGILPAFEEVTPATFALPDATDLGDADTCSLLRDAIRLGFRATSGPFRSFGHIAVEPRPYQLVPLLMAMKQSPVRLLIADDVGIGKTIEAALIARELLDRGEIRRLAVLCPPHLTEQWQIELAEKFHIEAQVVLPSTVRKLERGLGIGDSLFQKYPFTIVSLDYIKSDRRRTEFLRSCPEMVIVDEAHTCASALGGKGTMQRYGLVRDLAAQASRHMLLVSATPHSGKDDVFRALLSFLHPSLAHLPEDLSGKAHESQRKTLAEYFIQRRRGDIRAYMDVDTPFPERELQEITWKLSPELQSLLERILSLAQENLARGQQGTKFQQRISWWSTLALLRAIASSPAAAANTLRNRAIGVDNQDDVEFIENAGRQSLFDLADSEEVESLDLMPGADTTDVHADDEEKRRYKARLQKLARDAEAICGKTDTKLHGLTAIAKKLMSTGYAPIIFCRFIPTANYVGEYLRTKIRDVEVMVVTGMLPPAEREFRIQEMGKKEKRILVCTDCLSEGINLQEYFDAVIHYDLSWNPTRHEQREGRVDRFGQARKTVRIITYYGVDNHIDAVILKVLLRKHEAIRKALGVSVPIPEDAEKIMQAIVEDVLNAPRKAPPRQVLLPGLESPPNTHMTDIAQSWDKVAKREEKRSRTLFAQQSIKVDDVARELDAANEAAGNSHSVHAFVTESLRRFGVHCTKSDTPIPLYDFSFADVAQGISRRLVLPKTLQAQFTLPVEQGVTFLSRTHAFVERLASYVLTTALDPLEKSITCRAGVMRTSAVQIRTTLLLCRFRFQLNTFIGVQEHMQEHTQLTEECAVLAFSGAPESPLWLTKEEAETVLLAQPTGNILPDQAQNFILKVTEGMQSLYPHVQSVMNERGLALLDAHRRVRTAAKVRGLRYDVIPQGMPDILGIYVYLPDRAAQV